jgi:hypothetical protein
MTSPNSGNSDDKLVRVDHRGRLLVRAEQRAAILKAFDESALSTMHVRARLRAVPVRVQHPASDVGLWDRHQLVQQGRTAVSPQFLRLIGPDALQVSRPRLLPANACSLRAVAK